MKKTALFLAVMLLLSMVVFASCKPSNPSEEPACHHVDRNADLVCDLCQAAVDAIPQPEVPDIGNPDWKPEGGNGDPFALYPRAACRYGCRRGCARDRQGKRHRSEDRRAYRA